MGKNLVFAHSGGVTSVINAIASGLITRARESGAFNQILAAQNGIQGLLQESLFDTSIETQRDIDALKFTPGSAFGSCRYKLGDPITQRAEFTRLFDVFRAHDIGYFIYNGGNDSQDTAHKVWQMSQLCNYPVVCLGIPKTIDNDLPHTDCCPGFGSTAKYIATSTREASMDIASMCATSTKVFILEVMGRHAGWIAAAAALAQQTPQQGPHLILLPEVAFDPERFLTKVQQTVDTYGHCVVVASEGIQDATGQFVATQGTRDAFGHQQLGGVAPTLAQLVTQRWQFKTHWAVSDYLQRSARHIASAVDVEQSYALGQHAIEQALLRQSGVMLTIERLSSTPYRWQIGQVALEKVANVEKKVPAEMIDESGMHVTKACRDYIRSLIQGESHPPYIDGLPNYVTLKNKAVKRHLPTLEAV